MLKLKIICEGKRYKEQTQYNCKPRRLRDRGKETTDRRGCTLIHIRRPEMKRHDGHLEAEPHRQQSDKAKEQRERNLSVIEHAGEFINICRAGEAEDQAKSIE